MKVNWSNVIENIVGSFLFFILSINFYLFLSAVQSSVFWIWSINNDCFFLIYLSKTAEKILMTMIIDSILISVLIINHGLGEKIAQFCFCWSIFINRSNRNDWLIIDFIFTNNYHTSSSSLLSLFLLKHKLMMMWQM